MKTEEMRTIGVVVSSHGLQGTLKVESLSDFPERFEAIKSVYLVQNGGTPLSYQIKRVKWAGQFILLTLHELTTRTEADKLRGAELCVALKDSWKLPEDVFYISDLLGFHGVGEDGTQLGELKETLAGAQDLLLFEGEKGELLVPFVSTWVGKVDPAARTIEILNWKQLVEAVEAPPPKLTDDH